jgi:hypothetical protein
MQENDRMKRFGRLVIVLLWTGALSVTSAWGWGSDGHRAIAAVAFTHLNATAHNAVMAILNSTNIPEVTTLTDAATWPDDIKSGHPPFPGGKHHHTSAATNFVARFPHHDRWHYVNYPLDGPSYTLSGAFSRPDDIVHQIRLCIDVLQQPPGAGLNKKEALAFLTHLVGDLHQPLHVACGYYTLNSLNIAQLVTNPTQPHDAFHERGGNGLRWMSGQTEKNFHSFWDNDLVSANGSTEVLLQSRLALHWQNAGLLPDGGAIKSWPAYWANQSIAKARAVYFDATGEIGTKGTDKDDPAQGTVVIQVPISAPTYKLKHKEDAMDQLTKAAFHLATLLNKINWN